MSYLDALGEPHKKSLLTFQLIGDIDIHKSTVLAGFNTLNRSQMIFSHGNQLQGKQSIIFNGTFHHVQGTTFDNLNKVAAKFFPGKSYNVMIQMEQSINLMNCFRHILLYGGYDYFVRFSKIFLLSPSHQDLMMIRGAQFLHQTKSSVHRNF